MALWTPAEITTALWLDAADADTITLNSGNVSQWDDKSTNNRHATQENSVAQPLYDDDGFNLSPTLVFDGLDLLSVTHHASISAGGGVSVFVVLETQSTATDKGPIGKWQSGGLDWIIWRASAGIPVGNTGSIVRLSGNSFSDAGAIGLGQYVYELIIDAGSNQKFFVDGDEKDSVAISTPAAGTSPLSIGSYDNTGNKAFTGKISEVVITDGAIGQTDRQKIEGYLAWKWGLEANLPALHPYELAPPETEPAPAPINLLTSLITATTARYNWSPGTPQYEGLVLAASPAVYYRLDETSGTAIADASPSVNNGVIAGTYTLGETPAPGLDGTAIRFVNAGITPGNIAALPHDGTTGIAIEFLIKLYTSDSPSNAYIASRGNTGEVVFNYGGANRVSWFKNTGTGGTVASNAFGPTVPRDDQWHHIVIGWNPENSRYEAYLDGQLDSHYTRTAPVLSQSLARIGRATNDAAPFRGGLDEVAMYDYFPSAAEIAQRAEAAGVT